MVVNRLVAAKNHHYLPQSYLAGFTRGGTRDSVFWVFDAQTGEYRPQTPKNTGAERYFYAADTETGERSLHIEKGLAKIEGLVMPIVKKADAGAPITLDDKQLLALFVGLLFTRVPQFKRAHAEATDGMARAMHEVAFGTVEQVRTALQRWEHEHGEGSSVTAEELHEFIKSGEYDVVPQRNTYLRAMLEAGGEFGWRLWQMTWLIARAPSDTSFITSDSPFVIMPPLESAPDRPYGFGTRGAVTLVPLTQRVCLCISGPGTFAVQRVIPKSEVREINIAIAQKCERFVIGRDEALVRNIVAKSRVERLARRPLIHAG